jgi:hypothetical protein
MPSTMFLDEHEKVLYALVSEDPWEGDVAAPTGAWTTFTLTEEQREEIVATLGHDVGDEIVGHWIITEDSFGLLWFHKYEEEAFAKEVTALESQYEAWLGQG